MYEAVSFRLQPLLPSASASRRLRVVHLHEHLVCPGLECCKRGRGGGAKGHKGECQDVGRSDHAPFVGLAADPCAGAWQGGARALYMKEGGMGDGARRGLLVFKPAAPGFLCVGQKSGECITEHLAEQSRLVGLLHLPAHELLDLGVRDTPQPQPSTYTIIRCTASHTCEVSESSQSMACESLHRACDKQTWASSVFMVSGSPSLPPQLCLSFYT